MTESESVALPLGDTPICFTNIYFTKHRKNYQAFLPFFSKNFQIILRLKFYAKNVVILLKFQKELVIIQARKLACKGFRAPYSNFDVFFARKTAAR